MESTVNAEISDVSVGKPHVVIVGAGASRAALPDGDKNGRTVPLLREVARALKLSRLFPGGLRGLAKSDFEAAYSRLAELNGKRLAAIDKKVDQHFAKLELPEKATIYDLLTLCLRDKDAIFTFNWDPFLIQARLRLQKLGIKSLPRLFFLHGNVAIAYCPKDGYRGIRGTRCILCSQPLKESPLLYPVEKKKYQDGGLIEHEWKAARIYLKNCFMLTVFGYGAPKTDVEAIKILKAGWGALKKRQYEQTEIISRPGCDEKELRKTWAPFIHTHHYQVLGSFHKSWMANHPRRTGEAYWKQFIEAQFIDDHRVPRKLGSLKTLVKWFAPLLERERKVTVGVRK